MQIDKVLQTDKFYEFPLKIAPSKHSNTQLQYSVDKKYVQFTILDSGWS